MNTIYNQNCEEGLDILSDKSVNCIVTSPPYFGLRDYGHEDQVGIEETPEEYIQRLVGIFRKCKRVLRDDGTLWVNIGDSYARQGGSSGGGNRELLHLEGKQKRMGKLVGGLKSKDLIGIPWMLAFALRADGWYLRQDIIWAKPNPMPESVTDRCTKSHEYIFLLSKSAKYYFDHNVIKKPMAASSKQRLNQDVESQAGSESVPGKTKGTMKAVGTYVGGKKKPDQTGEKDYHRTRNSNGYEWKNTDGLANKRDVWIVSTKPFREAHFAVFPPDLIEDCIKAGAPKGGIVLDPFMGAGTVALVAKQLDRCYVGFEINQDYIDIANRRLKKDESIRTTLDSHKNSRGYHSFSQLELPVDGRSDQHA